MLGIQGKTLSTDEITWLNHPLTAGVILFTRNYDSNAQIREFIRLLRQTAKNDILIAVDHEGGRVQRFQEGFTKIPPMAKLGKIYDVNREKGLAIAQALGYVLAYEIADCDIDFSFAPVLDVQTDFSQVIGDRGFHSDVDKIGCIAGAFYAGMRDAGTIGVGKHFPGHGNVVADSHQALPVCERDFKHLQKTDLPPFKALINQGIEAIMPAHILYSAIDSLPAGFSDFWLQDILRQQLHFDGCIISDDLDMAGAVAFGSITQRIQLAVKNCDLILLCNNQESIKVAFNNELPTHNSKRQARLQALKRRAIIDKLYYEKALDLLRKIQLISA
ncbi:MAG: beta-N-acetylhexosaminidase [Ostreibacterium sp.]